jgi:molybdenum-dependent DNA-binding transcriptional regulator ModE
MSDEKLVRLASDYAEAIAAGARGPVEVAAKRHRISTTKARDWIFKARERGLLTRTLWGRAGGALTDRGRTILSALKRPQKQAGKSRGTTNQEKRRGKK